MDKKLNHKYLFTFIDKLGLWSCIHRDNYLNFSYGDPCYIGRGKTTNKAFKDLLKREKNNDWTNLQGNDPRK